MPDRFQALFLISGIALVVVGFNGERSIAIAGLAMIVLAVAGALRGRRE